jgi:hypothetical protein
MKNMPRCVPVVMAVALAAAGTVACSTAGTHDAPTAGVEPGDSVLVAVDPGRGADATTQTGATPDNCRVCLAGYTCCGTLCRDLQTDPNNCGSCGHVCASGDSCCSGSCVNEQTSVTHCGACDVACSGDGSCVSGACLPPSGWLYTSGGKIYLSNGSGSTGGSGGTQWMGRGVNVDDIFLGGYNPTLTLVPDAGGTLETLVQTAITGWKPNFLRVSLYLDSPPYLKESWVTGDAGAYKTPMTNFIKWIGDNYLDVWVLVTLRSDASMLDGGEDGTGLPTTMTDATYVALVDSFSTMSTVLFGISNEPGGYNTFDAGTVSSAMSHAVGVIRAEENRLAVPHHIVSVQGTDYTQDISYYSTSPLSYDNVVYEYHGYQPVTGAYTYTSIPVIVGEYGPDHVTGAFDAGAFYGNVETKQIPNLAWDMEPYNDDPPDLVQVNHSDTHLDASTWGAVVQPYLLNPAAY